MAIEYQGQLIDKSLVTLHHPNVHTFVAFFLCCLRFWTVDLEVTSSMTFNIISSSGRLTAIPQAGPSHTLFMQHCNRTDALVNVWHRVFTFSSQRFYHHQLPWDDLRCYLGWKQPIKQVNKPLTHSWDLNSFGLWINKAIIPDMKWPLHR